MKIVKEPHGQAGVQSCIILVVLRQIYGCRQVAERPRGGYLTAAFLTDPLEHYARAVSGNRCRCRPLPIDAVSTAENITITGLNLWSE